MPSYLYNTHHRLERSKFIEARLFKLIGKYREVPESKIEDIRLYFQKSDQQFQKREFLDKLEELKSCEYVSTFDIIAIVSESNLDIDASVL